MKLSHTWASRDTLYLKVENATNGRGQHDGRLLRTKSGIAAAADEQSTGERVTNVVKLRFESKSMPSPGTMPPS